jgi:hypothetical protein
MEDICKITVYITERAYREPVYRTVGKWLKGVYPCSTGLIVQGLARPEWVMEIDVEAVIPEARAAKETKAVKVAKGGKAAKGGRAGKKAKAKK